MKLVPAQRPFFIKTGKRHCQHDQNPQILQSQNPLHRYDYLQHLITGETTHNGVNVDRSKEIGKSILKDMDGRHVKEYVFKKKAVTMDSKSTVKLNNEVVHIDPQLLFQRLLIAATQKDMLAEAFKYELCWYPPALF